MVFKIIKSNDIVFLSEILLCFPNQASTGPVYMPLQWSPSAPPCFCSNPASTICQGIPTLLLDTPYTLLTQILVLDCTDIPGLDLTLTCVHTHTSPAKIKLSARSNMFLAFVFIIQWTSNVMLASLLILNMFWSSYMSTSKEMLLQTFLHMRLAKLQKCIPSSAASQ